MPKVPIAPLVPPHGHTCRFFKAYIILKSNELFLSILFKIFINPLYFLDPRKSSANRTRDSLFRLNLPYVYNNDITIQAGGSQHKGAVNTKKIPNRQLY